MTRGWPARSQAEARVLTIRHSRGPISNSNPKCVGGQTARIANAVAEVAFHEGVAGITRPASLLAHVCAQMYDPHYETYA